MSTQKIVILLLISFGLMGCNAKKTKTISSEPRALLELNKKLLQKDFERKSGTNEIYFAFDDSSLSKVAQTTLEKQAEWLNANPDTMVMIEGHCDDRGSKDYNVDLGLRRAKAAKSFLIKQGIDKERIRIASYGEENPEFSGHSSKAHRLNRKDVVIIIN